MQFEMRRMRQISSQSGKESFFGTGFLGSKLMMLASWLLAHGFSHLLTFNGGDFKRFTEITVVNPRDVS